MDDYLISCTASTELQLFIFKSFAMKLEQTLKQQATTRTSKQEHVAENRPRCCNPVEKSGGLGRKMATYSFTVRLRGRMVEGSGVPLTVEWSTKMSRDMMRNKELRTQWKRREKIVCWLDTCSRKIRQIKVL